MTAERRANCLIKRITGFATRFVDRNELIDEFCLWFHSSKGSVGEVGENGASVFAAQSNLSSGSTHQLQWRTRICS